MLYRIVRFFVLGCLLAIAHSGQSQTRAQELARLQFVIDSVSQTYTGLPNTHAITIGVIDGGNTQAFSFGAIDPSDNRLADAQTVFEIGPVSQTITATLLAAYADSGYVDLDVSILQYLPDTLQNNPHLMDITLRNLSNHTSGLPLLPDNFASVDSLNPPDQPFYIDPVEAYTADDLYDFLLHFQGGDFTPGTDYQYSELGYGVIGTILSRVSGRTFEEMLIERFTSPLGLENTGSIPYADQDYAISHGISGADMLPGTYDALAGAMGIKSSLRDMLVYARAHFVLPESPIEMALARTRQFTYYIPPETDLGMAWHMHLTEENLVYSYYSDARGSSTYIAIAPDERKAVVVLSNSAESVEECGRQILIALLRLKPER